MLFLITFGLIASVSALVSKGTCPDVSVVQHFNLTALAARTWYQVARYPNDIDKQGDCIHFTFEPEGDSYKMILFETLDDKIRELIGHWTYDLKYGGDKGELLYSTSSFKDSNGVTSLPVHIVDVDYNRYCIFYSCINNESEKTKTEHLWITSPSYLLNTETKLFVDKFIQTTDYIDSEKVIWGHFDIENCYVED